MSADPDRSPVPADDGHAPAPAAEDVAPAASGSQPDLPFRALRRPGRRRLIWAASLVLLIVAITWTAQWFEDWNRLGQIEPSAGLYFVKRVELPVPLFRQGDPQWREDLLGPTPGTLGAEGCAISSAAMILASYGIDTDPQRLNKFLTEHEGYTPQGWVYWEKAAEIAPDKVKHIYEDLASPRLIDENLLRGNPVIAKLRLPSGTTHFVVIAGKDGFDYLTRDPGAGSAKGLYPLRDLRSRILGIRFYQKL